MVDVVFLAFDLLLQLDHALLELFAGITLATGDPLEFFSNVLVNNLVILELCKVCFDRIKDMILNQLGWDGVTFGAAVMMAVVVRLADVVTRLDAFATGLGRAA